MAINFPANPAVGEQFSTGTATYVFNGSYWTIPSTPAATYQSNDFVTYQYLKIDVQEDGSSVVEAPSVLNFTGSGVSLTSDGREITINVSGGGTSGSSSNEYATYINAISEAFSNDWATWSNLNQNSYVTWSKLNQNSYATWSNLQVSYRLHGNLISLGTSNLDFVGSGVNVYFTGGNLTINVSGGGGASSSNEYATYINAISEAFSNDWTTWSNSKVLAHANDWATYNNTLAVAFSNDYATYDLLSIIVQQEGINKYTAPKVLNFVGTAFTLNTIGDEVVISLPDLADAAEANAYLTYLAALGNDWVTYNNILGSESAEFTASKTFLQDVTIVGNLIVVGNSVTASQESLAIAASNITLNDGGLDATAIGGGIFVEGTNNVLLTKIEYDPSSASKWYIDGEAIARFTDFQSNDLITFRHAEGNDWYTYNSILANSNARFSVTKYFDEDLIARAVYPENDATYGLGTLANQWKFLRLSEELLINSISVTANSTNLLLPASTLIGEIDVIANQWVTYDRLVNNSEYAFNVSKIFSDGLTVNGNLSVGYSGVISNVKLIDGNVILNYNSTTENASNVQIIVKGTDDQTLTYLGYDPEVSSKWVIDDIPVALAPDYQANDYATFTNSRIQIQYEGSDVYLGPSNLHFTGPGVFVSTESANVNVHIISADITKAETYTNDYITYTTTIGEAHANDYALYQILATTYRERGSDVSLTPTIIDFVGANLSLSGSILTVQVSEAFLIQTNANDYATLSNAYANDYTTKNYAEANDYLTRSSVTGNIYTTYITLAANDYTTYSVLTSNDYGTYQNITGNLYQTHSVSAANDYSTYATITGNLYASYATLAANDYSTLKATEANDWLTYKDITSNRDADFLSDKSFRGNVHIHANLFVYGNVYTTTVEELFIANNRFIINDNGTDESAEYGGILVEGTNNNLIGAFLFTADSQTHWRINGGDLENLGTSANDVATFGYFQANDYLTFRELTLNIHATYSNLNINTFATYSNAVANDYLTYSLVTGNVYSTYAISASNDYLTYIGARANDWSTYNTLKGDITTLSGVVTSSDLNVLNAARANDWLTLGSAHGNDLATYNSVTSNIYTTFLNLSTTIRDENVDLIRNANSINFTGGGVTSTIIGRDVTITISGSTDRPTLFANDYATWSNLNANDYTTYSELTSNDLLTYRIALANDYATYRYLSTNAFAYVSDNVAPQGIALGALWWNSNDGQLYIRYGDEDSEQWVATNPITTATVDALSYAITTVNITGQTSITANTASSQLRFIGGEGVTLETNAVNSSITITSTGGSGGGFHVFLLAGM